ncbi:MAG: type I methionyl aminopeptidase [Nocardioidaceae bacterium]
MFDRQVRIQLKSPEQLALMRAAGLVVADALAAMRAAVEVGVTTIELDHIAAGVIRAAGARPSFLGYHGFPATICASVNDQIVHGFPSVQPLRDGDLVSLDCGAILDGWHGDAAITVGVGEVTPELVELMRVTEESMWQGIAAARAEGRLSDIGHAVETYVRGQGPYGIVEEYGGHGIGTEMHQDPHVLNHGRPGRGPGLKVGMALAIEPMVTLGRPKTEVLDDDWTVVTVDGSYAAHFEHSIAITADGPKVLTAPRDDPRALTDSGPAAHGRW